MSFVGVLLCIVERMKLALIGSALVTSSLFWNSNAIADDTVQQPSDGITDNIAGSFNLSPAAYAIFYKKRPNGQDIARSDFGTRKAEFAVGLEAHAGFRKSFKYGVDKNSNNKIEDTEVTKAYAFGVAGFVGAFGLGTGSVADAGLVAGGMLTLHRKTQADETVKAFNIGYGSFVQGGRDVVVKSDAVEQVQKTQKKTVYGRVVVFSVSFGF